MFTFTDLLLASGALAAATAITLLISVLKTSIPPVAAWNGALMAFVASAILYILAAIDLNKLTLDGGLEVSLSWLACAAAAVGVHKFLVNPIIDKVQS